MPKVLICLDPGHVSKYNRGAYPSYCEGTEMYNYSLVLANELEKYDGISTCNTRSNVSDYPNLAARAKIAKNKGALFLLSLHTNGADFESAKYVMIYGSVAMRTKSDPLANQLCSAITDLYKKEIDSGINNNGVAHQTKSNGQDYMGVLRNATGGSVQYSMLIEHGFHSNYKTCHWLYQKENQQKLAKVVAATIAGFFGCKLKATQPTVPEIDDPEDPTTPDQPSGHRDYIVIRGDSWWKIANRELGDGNRYKELASFNGKSADATIYAGQVIKIPTGGSAPASTTKNYVVVKGDSLWRIAERQLGDGNRYKEIAKASGISTSAALLIGMILKVPVK